MDIGTRLRELQLKLYESFLTDCTSSNSVNNLTNFKRINECITEVQPDSKDVSILDFNDAVEFSRVVKAVLELEKFKEYDAKGKKQYSNALFWYQRFLNAKKLFSSSVLSDEGNNRNAHMKRNNNVVDSLQQIFYGAPGTGKSHEVKTRTGELSDSGEERDLPYVFRTTFHPDTDYASFVGCYKPSMRKTGKKYQVDGKDVDDEEIIYEFVPQTFTDAYVYAYMNPTEPTYLVIEEINRGNCAQIFGDLFQLLDRKNGVSEYKIKADKDLAKYLNDELGKDADGIKDGKLCLPANLNILATMNTSDQSLFPMDSAFKRRWEWKYIKIADAHKDWKIETNGEDWYGFICQINRIINNMTSSADKQLGYFFCQANEEKKITTETFVSKVIFYLWNDVFKDYGFDDANLFKYKKVDEDGNRVGEDLDLTFPDFYDEDGYIVDDVVKQFIEHVMAWEKDKKKDNN